MRRKRKKERHAPWRGLLWLGIVLLLGYGAYTYSYAVFADQPAASSSEGEKVTVQVSDGMDAFQVGKLLKKNGLVKNAFVFWGQSKAFLDQGASIQPGVYVLDTSMDVEEILETLSGGEDSDG